MRFGRGRIERDVPFIKALNVNAIMRRRMKRKKGRGELTLKRN
jgi:hypothetical protein